MPRPSAQAKALLEDINLQVAKLSNSGLAKFTESLETAKAELARDITKWRALGKGEERFTIQLYKNSMTHIESTLDYLKGPVQARMNLALQEKGVQAAKLAAQHLKKEVKLFSGLFENIQRPISLRPAGLLAEGKSMVWGRFARSIQRYTGQVGLDIKKQLSVGVVRGETVDQLTRRLINLGGPKMHYLANGKPEYIAEGLFVRYKHYAERLAVTETAHAYNQFALEGIQKLDKDDSGYFKKWDAAVDAKTCPNCGEYDGNIVEVNATFRGDLQCPPLHPRCRCAVVAWRKEWQSKS